MTTMTKPRVSRGLGRHGSIESSGVLMTNKRQDWETIKNQAPDLAAFLIDINLAFGKPTAVRVELLQSGEVIEIGGPLKCSRMDSPTYVCKDCQHWRKDQPSDGAGVCTQSGRGLRSWIVDWPTHVACDLFELDPRQ